MSATKCHLGVGNDLEPCLSSWQKQDYRRLRAIYIALKFQIQITRNAHDDTAIFSCNDT